MSPARDAAFATSIPPPTIDWKARALPDRSLANILSKLSLISTASLSLSSADTRAATGTTDACKNWRQASRRAVPSACSSIVMGTPHVARTAMTESDLSVARTAGGFAPMRFWTRSRRGAPCEPSPQPEEVLSMDYPAFAHVLRRGGGRRSRESDCIGPRSRVRAALQVPGLRGL